MFEKQSTKIKCQHCKVSKRWIGSEERTTGTELSIPIHPVLRTIIDATPSGHLTFLITEFGKPFAVAGFGNWFREQCDIANLHHCTFHGLRKAASVRLAEAGLQPARDCGDYRPCEPQRDCPLHQYG
jgi:integrase